MEWIVRTFGSSIGKKLLMAVTGLSFILFLAVHLAGNLTLYGGSGAFTAYAEKLHSLGVLVTVMEMGLLIMAIVHILTGGVLFYGNLTARGQRYAVNKRAGGRTLGSATMPYTGLFLLGFVIVHLMNFHFVDKTGTTLFAIVHSVFTHPGYALFYILAGAVAAVHVSHGLWSAFQTLGISHPKYTPLLKGLSLVFSLVVGIGFGFIPVYFLVLT